MTVPVPSLDVAAIRSRAALAAHAPHPCSVGDRLVAFRASAADVPALLAALEAVSVERDEARAALARIEALHVRVEWDSGIFVCEACRMIEYDAIEDDISLYSGTVEWPCPTIAALRGDEG